MKNLPVLLLGILYSAVCHSHEEVKMADTLRSEGKIYVVVTVVVIILIGIILYLILIDRKVSNMEKKLGKK